MTIQQFLNGLIYVGAVVGAIGAIGGAFHFAVVKPLRSFLRREIVSELVGIKDAVELSNTQMEQKLNESTQAVEAKVEEVKTELTTHINGHSH